MAAQIFLEVIELFEAYLIHRPPTPDLTPVASEILGRLRTLSGRYLAILNLNNTLLNSSRGVLEFRKMASDENIASMLRHAAQTDPTIAKFLEGTGGRIVRRGTMEQVVQTIGEPTKNTDVDPALMEKLHSEVESFYHDLWVITLRLSELLGIKFRPKGLTNVRNHLIEHTDGPGSGATILSFGISTNGPVLRPLKPTGVPAPHDLGFIANVDEFLQKTKAMLTV
jgi:hypothetical protein